MKKKWYKVVAMMLLAVLLITGCGSAKPEANKDSEAVAESSSGTSDKELVRVIVPGLSDVNVVDPISGIETKSLHDFEAFLNEKIADYEIKVLTISWDGWIQKLEAMINAGEADVGFFTNQEAASQWFADLTPYLEKDEVMNLDNLTDWFIEPAVHYSYYKSFNYPEATNKIFGLPMTMACNALVYDSQLFEEWGIAEPTADMTMSEVVDIAEQMTGANPVTGKKNYGGQLHTSLMEWNAVSYDAVKAYSSNTMDINELDQAEYVDYIKTSEEVRKYMSDMIRMVDACSEAVATGGGAENFFTADNDVAITFHANQHLLEYMKYVYAGDNEVTARFKPLLLPTGPENGMAGFPEFFKFAMTKTASNPDAAWEVIKTLTTDKEIVDFYLTNYQPDKITCLKDYDGVTLMEYDINKARYEYQLKAMFITDDYWYWRTTLKEVNNQLLSKQYTEEEAVEAFYEGVNSWVENIKSQAR